MEQSGNVYLKRDRLAELENELRELKTAKRKEIALKIAEARSHGDLSENAEYDAAKEEQSHLELKIAKLEHTLSRAIVIDEGSMPEDQIHILSNVKVKDITYDEEITFELVSPEEADFELDKISVISPLGKELLGKKVGDKVSVDVQNGVIEYLILEIFK
jgi:transcription elongation factor GreA